MENLMKTRQYEGVLKDPLPIVPVNKLGKDEQIIRIGEPREDQKRTSDYLLMSRKLSYSDWTLNLFIPLDENYAKALRTAVVSAGAVAFILLLVLYLHQATIRIRERERSRLALEEANHKLETKNRELQQVSEVLHQTSITDHLTGAYNRRFFLESLPKLISTASRHGHPLSILMIDVDNFKNINDKFGHPVGDKVLQTLAAICTEAIREADVFARFGGEEFIIALPDTEERAAHEVAERLRMAVINNPIDHNGALVRITISCGVSQYRPEDVYVEHVIKRADQALYAAKTSGRNRAVVQ
jgi:diguanylate cyclase (GGDEF)-like protein